VGRLNGAGREPEAAQTSMRKHGAFYWSCTKMEAGAISKAVNARNRCKWAPARSFTKPREPRMPPAIVSAAKACAESAHPSSEVAQYLLYWCRSIYPGGFFCLRCRISGRAGMGQLDWAAAESAEFVNQEIGYE
jgi:hypothetical protein